MSGQNPEKKNFISAICTNCNKVINIGTSHDVRYFLATVRTLRERIKFEQYIRNKLHVMKNSQIQGLYKAINQLMNIMTDEQRAQAHLIHQSLRDTMKKAEKEAMK